MTIETGVYISNPTEEGSDQGEIDSETDNSENAPNATQAHVDTLDWQSINDASQVM